MECFAIFVTASQLQCNIFNFFSHFYDKFIYNFFCMYGLFYFVAEVLFFQISKTDFAFEVDFCFLINFMRIT